MKNCPDCNAQVEEQAVFCDNCGLRLNVSPVVEPAAATPPSTASSQAPNFPPRFTGSTGPDAGPGTCSVCGYANVPGEMFCQNCGVQLAPVASAPPPPPSLVAAKPAQPSLPQPVTIDGKCPNCGASNQPGNPFCQNCGLQLTPAEITPPPPAPVAARPAQPSLPQPVTTDGKCPNCGDSNQPGNAFCQNCGLQLTDSEPIAVPAHSLGVQATPYIDRQGASVSSAPEVESPKPVVYCFIARATHTEIEIPGNKSELTLGRSDPVRNIFPDVDLTVHGGDTSGVSRLHARLTIKGGQVYIEDLNSTNFTHINRDKLQPGKPTLLKLGDEVRLGLISLDFAQKP